jgi:hypothetical protein
MQTSNKTTRFKLTALILIFVIPLLIGWFLFHYHEHFQFKTTNYGTLIQPAIPVKQLATTDWQIVYVPAACTGDEERTKFSLHQLHTALGKNQDRVSLTWVTTAACKQKAHDFRKVVFTKKDFSALNKQLMQPQHTFVVKNKIYLIDPNGNLFMYYKSDADPMNILKDMKKVLEVSQIG